MDEGPSSFVQIVYLAQQYFVVSEVAGRHRLIPCGNRRNAEQVLAEQQALLTASASDSHDPGQEKT